MCTLGAYLSRCLMMVLLEHRRKNTINANGKGRPIVLFCTGKEMGHLLV